MNILAEDLNTDMVLDESIIDKWNTVIPLLAKYHVDKTIEITPVQAEKYRFDMWGLFKELNIPDTHIYPHIRCNGYLSSTDYDGWKLRLDILKYDIVDKYYKLFTAKRKQR